MVHKCRTLHKRVAAIGFQTAMPSIPVVDKANKELLLKGVKYCIDLELEKTITFSFRNGNFHFAFMTLVNHLGSSLIGVALRVLLGAFCTFPSPNNWRIICRPWQLQCS